MTQADYKVMVRSLKKELKGRGAYAKIAEMAGVTIGTVSRVLDGVFVNDKVLNAAIECRDELRIKEEQRLVRLSKAIGS